MYKFIFKTLLALALLLGATTAIAQHTPEERFEKVRLLSGEEKYEEAIEVLNSLISDHPNNLDYKIYLGRVYSWSGNYDAARDTLLPIVKNHSENEEALQALLNTYLWSGEYEKVLEYVEVAINRFRENKVEYQLIKLRVLEEKDSVKDGLSMVDSLRKSSSNSKRVKAAETRLLKKQKNNVQASYTNSYFTTDQFDAWHLGSISYSRDWEKIPTEFRLSYANLFNRYDIQFETDLYPEISQQSYLYLNLGIAPKNILFPVFRAGAEYFYEFNSGLSLSGGGRFLKFSDDTIPMVTGHARKNWRDYYLQYRPVLVMKDHDFFPTHTVSVRKNWFVNESFIQLDLQYGTVPYFLFITEDFERVSSKGIGFQSQFRIEKNLLVKLSLMYEQEEYSPENFRSRINSQLILRKRF